MYQLPGRSPRTLEDYWVIARRRLWWLILPLFLGWLLVLGASFFMAPKYRSETVIIVEPQRVAEQYVIPNISADVQERLQSMMQQILSRTRLQGIIGRFHLYGNDRGPVDSDALVQQMRRDIKIDLVSGRPGELSAFKISYSAPSALVAQQVTNELSSLFIDENMHSRQRLSENTTEFLENQVENALRDLSQQEERLHNFKSRYLGELPEQLQVNTQILSGLETRLQVASQALDEANQQRLYLESLPAHYQGSPGEDQNREAATPAAVDEQLIRLKAQLADLSAHYMPNHPDVRRVKEQIAASERLRQRLEADAVSSKSQASAANADNLHDPSRAPQIKSQFGDARLKITYREREINKLEKQIEAYQSRLNMTPLREQELAEITRDYNQAKSNYDSLLAKKTQSEMASSLEKRQEGELFRIIDPPNLPQKPYTPDRLKFSLLGLACGLFLAVALTVLVATIDVRIYHDEDLRDLISVPILGGIPLLQTENEQRRARRYQRLEAVMASALLAVIPAITLLTHYRN